MNFFKNESECLTLGGLTIENRVDRVSLYGSADFTLTQEGLQAAKDLKAVLDGVVRVLEAVCDLPEKIEIVPPVEVKNPF